MSKKEENINKEEKKQALKINLKTFIIITIIIVLAIGTIIEIVITNNKRKSKDNSTNLIETSNTTEFEDKKQTTKFEPKKFEQKYLDLYNIVKGSDETINGITYSYKNKDVYSSLCSALDYGINKINAEDKLNIIYNGLNIENDITVQDIKDIIKKYYNLDENFNGDSNYLPELNIYIDKNSATKFVLSGDTYEMQNSYKVINTENINEKTVDTTSGYLLGLLDNVKEEENKIILTEKVFKVNYDGKYKLSNIDGELIDTINNLNDFDIAKHYDSIRSYEYIFTKRDHGTYYLSEFEANYKYQKEPSEGEDGIILYAPNKVFTIEDYIDVLHPAGTSIPDFDNINNADRNWIWHTVRCLIDVLDTRKENNEISYNGITKIANIIFGDDFKQKFPSSGDYYLSYNSDSGYYKTHSYMEWAEDYYPSYVIKNITKQDEKTYIATIVEYVVIDDTFKGNGSTAKLYNNKDYYDGSEKYIKEFKNYDKVIGERETKEYVLKNVDKFTTKQLTINLDENHNFNITSCKTIK